MKGIGLFVVGGIIGAAVSYILTKKKYEKRIDELNKSIDTLYEAATRKKDNDDANNENDTEKSDDDAVETSEDDIDESEFNEDGSIKELTYEEARAAGMRFASDDVKEYKQIVSTNYQSAEPYLISEDEFCERNHYDKQYVMFNEDTKEVWRTDTGVTFDNHDIGEHLGLMDVDNTSGDGYIYIRNDRLSIDYAVDLTFTPGADHTGN